MSDTLYNTKYMERENFLSKEKVNKLINVLNLKNSEKSHLLEKHIYNDMELFDWVNENIVKKIPGNFVLLWDSLEVIRYVNDSVSNRQQDIVCTPSRWFTNHTFVVCLQECEDGNNDSKTLLYLDDDTVYESKSTARGLLVYRKEVPYEVKGESIVLRGNLVLLPDEILPKDGLLVINLAKSPGRAYIFPKYVLDAHEKSVYTRMYHNAQRYMGYNRVFDHNKHPNVNAVYYRDKWYCIGHEWKLDEDKFKFIYDTMMSTALTSHEMYNASTYSGVINTNKFHQFINRPSKTNPIYICQINDYYKLMPLNRDPSILPFQLITINDTVVWFGCYDNKFICCDYHKKIEEAYKVDLGVQKTVTVEECSWDRKYDYEIVTKYLLPPELWKNHGLKKMSDVSHINENKLIKQIEQFALLFTGSEEYVELVDSIQTEYDHYENEMDTDLISKLDFKKTMEKIQGMKTVSRKDLIEAHDKNYHNAYCDGGRFSTVDFHSTKIRYKFGFLKMNEFVVKNEGVSD